MFALLLLVQAIPADPERAALDEIRAARPAEGSGPAFDAWDAKYFAAQWDYGHVLRKRAEARKRRGDWEQVIRYWTDFTWERDDSLAALEARLIIARAHQALEQWGPVFSNLKAARVPGKAPELAEIATRALILEARARLAYGRDPEISLRAAREHLARHPSDAELYLHLRLETARLLHAAHYDLESRKVLEELLAAHPRTGVGDAALGLLAETFGRRLEEHAERLFETGDVLRAAVAFRRLPRAPRVSFRLGQCYRRAGRPLEAVDALRAACAVDSPDRLDAAKELEKILLQLDAPGLADHQAWMIRTFGAKAGDNVLFRRADALLRQQKFKEAAELFGRIEGDVEALHSRAYCHYRLKEYEKALELFRAYLASDLRDPRSSDIAMDYAAWCLAKLDRGAELLEHVERHAPKDPLRARWRLAHRVDALARLGRFEEARATVDQIKDDLGPEPGIRALERLAAGYEAVVRRKNDPKLWSAYARAVLALSEKSFKPLSGERLLAAADAIYLEATPDAYGLAYELYSRYVAGAKLPPEDARAIDYRRAAAAAGSGRLKEAAEICDALAIAEPLNGTYLELRADVLCLRAEALPRSPQRRELLERAVKSYGELASAVGVVQKNEAYYRLIWKYAARQAELDPDAARRFFRIMEAKGYGAWDEDRWGFRSKMAAVKKGIGQ
jgi:hypothetical protein